MIKIQDKMLYKQTVKFLCGKSHVSAYIKIVLQNNIFEPYPELAQGLLLVLHSGIIPVGLRGPYGLSEIKPMLVGYKASTLPAVP